MPITHHIKPDIGLVISIHVGTVPDDDFLESYKTLFGDPRFDRKFNRLVDLRRADSSSRSASMLQRVAQFLLEQYRDIDATPKTAIIAPQDISFGLARMFEAFTKVVPGAFAAFRAVDDALAWLGAPGNVMDDMEQDAQGVAADE